MKREPGKVAELHKSYLRGDLPFVKKVSPGDILKFDLSF